LLSERRRRRKDERLERDVGAELYAVDERVGAASDRLLATCVLPVDRRGDLLLLEAGPERILIAVDELDELCLVTRRSRADVEADRLTAGDR
jgi:hypothetical protein